MKQEVYVVGVKTNRLGNLIDSGPNSSGGNGRGWLGEDTMASMLSILGME